MAKLKRFSGTPVSEGVRLEVGKYTVFAVRNEDKDISVRIRREPRKVLRTLLRIPFLRGIVRMLRDIYRFFDGIAESAELHPVKVHQGSAFTRKTAQILHAHPQSVCTFFSFCLLPVIAFLTLYAAPLGAEALLYDLTALPRPYINAIVCAFRIVSMLFGIWCAGRLRVFKRLLMYRGAINRAVNCYECRDEITVENAMQYPRKSRRITGDNAHHKKPLMRSFGNRKAHPCSLTGQLCLPGGSTAGGDVGAVRIQFLEHPPQSAGHQFSRRGSIGIHIIFMNKIQYGPHKGGVTVNTVRRDRIYRCRSGSLFRNSAPRRKGKTESRPRTDAKVPEKYLHPINHPIRDGKFLCP